MDFPRIWYKFTRNRLSEASIFSLGLAQADMHACHKAAFSYRRKISFDLHIAVTVDQKDICEKKHFTTTIIGPVKAVSKFPLIDELLKLVKLPLSK